LLLFATYWSLGDRAFSGFIQDEMGHACEWETSMMLRIDPSLVGDITAAEPVEPGRPFLPAARGWITKDRSQPGHIGHPQAATAEKGETLLSRFTDDTSALLERVTHWDGISWNG
jgi:creatinine amidohydrolase